MKTRLYILKRTSQGYDIKDAPQTRKPTQLQVFEDPTEAADEGLARIRRERIEGGTVTHKYRPVTGPDA